MINGIINHQRENNMKKESKNSEKRNDNNKNFIIRVAVLADELLGWGSGKHYYPIILNGYTWTVDDISYTISTTYIYDRDVMNGRLTTSRFNVLLVPGGGVGDGKAILKGSNINPKTLKWKKNISNFIKDGGGYVGICGGAALMTKLNKEKNTKPTTFLERRYNKSALNISCIRSYYKNIAVPLFYPFQKKYPEKIGASAYVFSFAPGETIDGVRVLTSGVPIDFKIYKDNPIFSDITDDTHRIRWWGGPALQLPENLDREVKILARYPIKELSDDETTKINAWMYTGGIYGLFKGVLKAFKFIKKNNNKLNNLPLYSFYFAGDWKPSDKLIDLNFSNKIAMTSEVYPNKNNGRIILCSAHPEYMVWWGGLIDKVENNGSSCIANGFYKWKKILPLSKDVIIESTNSWWMIRRMVAWTSKIPDSHMPPISKEKLNEKNKELISKSFWNGTISHQMSNI